MSRLDELFNDNEEGELFAYSTKKSSNAWPPYQEQTESGAAIWNYSHKDTELDSEAAAIRQKLNLDSGIRIIKSPGPLILARIIANMRPHFNDPSRWPHFEYILESKDKGVKPTKEDYALANKVRTHFSDVLMDIISGKHVSKFRRDAYAFVNDMRYAIPETFMGLAVKLPGFYLQDQHYRALADTFNCAGSPEVAYPQYVGDRTFAAQYVDRTFSWTKRDGREYRYWFELDDPKWSGRLVSLRIAENNPLLSLLDNYIRFDAEIIIQGSFTFRPLLRSSLFCLEATHWSIAPHDLTLPRK